MRNCFILGFALLLTVCTGCNRDYRTFTDDTNRFSVDYPKSWTIRPGSQNGIAVTFQSPMEGLSDGFLESFSVTAGEIPATMTAEEFGKAIIDAPKSYIPKFKLLGEGTIHAGRLDPYFITYEGDLAGEKLVWKQIFFSRNGRGYSIVFTLAASRAESYSKIIDQVVSSFRIR